MFTRRTNASGPRSKITYNASRGVIPQRTGSGTTTTVPHHPYRPPHQHNHHNGGMVSKCLVLILLTLCTAVFVMFGDLPGTGDVLALDNERFKLLPTVSPNTKSSSSSSSSSAELPPDNTADANAKESQFWTNQQLKQGDRRERLEFSPEVSKFLSQDERVQEAQEEAQQEEKYRQVANQHFEEDESAKWIEETVAPDLDGEDAAEDYDHGTDDEFEQEEGKLRDSEDNEDGGGENLELAAKAEEFGREELKLGGPDEDDSNEEDDETDPDKQPQSEDFELEGDKDVEEPLNDNGIEEEPVNELTEDKASNETKIGNETAQVDKQEEAPKEDVPKEETPRKKKGETRKSTGNKSKNDVSLGGETSDQTHTQRGDQNTTGTQNDPNTGPDNTANTTKSTAVKDDKEEKQQDNKKEMKQDSKTEEKQDDEKKEKKMVDESGTKKASDNTTTPVEEPEKEVPNATASPLAVPVSPPSTNKKKDGKKKQKGKASVVSSSKDAVSVNVTLAPSDESKPTATIAYAISLIKCGDKQSTSAGLIDAALVMRHSIHLQSWRNPESGSKYDYNMYAIVHKDAVECSSVLENAGFTIVVKDPPIQPSEIKGAHLKKNIQKEWCCGHDEFVKLYAYDLPGKTKEAEPEPIVVHVDIDFAFFQPMDDLYDAILFDKESPEGKAARAKIPKERPDDPIPDQIDAFITRDYPQLLPGRIPGYQAGFLVARRDPSVVPQVLDVIREGNYVGGYDRENGWGGKGYGGYVGAMAMQGLMAYYYDHIRPNTTIELNSCRFNHMGMDNLFRGGVNFKKKSEWVGKCRSTRPDCEDCTITNTSQIYNIHYTQCRKPWNCVSIGAKDGDKGKAIDTSYGNLDHCLELTRKWHAVREDLENKLFLATKDNKIKSGMSSKYKPEIFLGHCAAEGSGGYTQIEGSTETFLGIPALYEGNEPAIDMKRATAPTNKDTTSPDKADAKGTPAPKKESGEGSLATADNVTETNGDITAGIDEDRPVEPASSTDSLGSATIAYVFAVTKCDPPLLDAALILRHSIHLQSKRNPSSGGKYDYKVYALVLKDADKCAGEYRAAGFDTVVEDSPFKSSKKKKFNFRKKKPSDLGILDPDEFVKLHAFDLPDSSEPIVVLVEPDVVLNKPLDELYDAMLLGKEETLSSQALERPDDVLPSEIDAFITRSYTYIMPGTTPPPFQNGLLVVRKNSEIVDDIIKIISEEKYVDGATETSGWGGAGYLGKTLNGVLSYYYGVVKKDSTVELSSCRFNHVGMDNLYRADPNFNKKLRKGWVGKCRSQRSDCEDCTLTNTTSIYSVRYASPCQKPWQCIAEGAPGGGKNNGAIDTTTGKLNHCLELTQLWHTIRSNLDATLLVATKDKKVAEGRQGKYRKDIFRGHCRGEGSKNYHMLHGVGESVKQLSSVYSDPSTVANNGEDSEGPTMGKKDPKDTPDNKDAVAETSEADKGGDKDTKDKSGGQDEASGDKKGKGKPDDKDAAPKPTNADKGGDKDTKGTSGGQEKAGGTKSTSSVSAPAIPRKDSEGASATIAYAISVTACDENDATYWDAVSVLRHSIHQNSIRTPTSGSKYDYRMYAIVHKDAEKQCGPILKEAGFVVAVKTSPVDVKALRKNKNYLGEALTGSGAKEYIQLNAYDLPTPQEATEPEPIAVLMDINVILFKPLDDLFDTMLLDKKKAKAARATIPLERPKESLPDQIDAFLTKTYTHRAPDSSMPARYQSGFLVVRRSPTTLKELFDSATKKGKYVKSKTDERSGWGGAGYTDRGPSGLLGYYYDKVKPDTSVELNSCRFNHIGMDNLYRAPPNYSPGLLRSMKGKCRSGQPECEDCTTTDVDLIYVARYHDEQCTKPWKCVTQGKAKGPAGTIINTESGKLDHCLDLLHEWHSVRSDLEALLQKETADKQVKKAQEGKHKKEVFEGHCQKEGVENYLPIGSLKKHMPKLPALYGKEEGVNEVKKEKML